MLKATLAAVTLIVPLAFNAAPVEAATAHNSQAGANGSTTDAAAPTGRHFKHMKHMKHKRTM